MPINAEEEYERYFLFTTRSVPEDWRRENGGNQESLRRYHAQSAYRRVALWDTEVHHRTAQNQFELDVAMWYGSLTKGSDGERAFLKRIFTVLYHGGLLYKGTNGWETWAASDIPIAAALSHGGRVLIQLPRAGGDAAAGFFNWLDGQDHIITANARLSATHGIEYLTYAAMQPLTADRRHRVNEVKKGNQNHYGVNISLGGTGNYNPLSGNLIASNGEHGHLYVYYLAPTEQNYGGLLVGLEGSAPIDAWDNRVSRFHTQGTSGRSGYMGVIGLGIVAQVKDWRGDPTEFTPDQTGGYHKFGDRQRYSPTGNARWEELQVGPRQVYNGMIVDLVETGWEFLQQVGNFDPVDLGASGPAPRQIVRPPVPKIMTHTCLTKVNLERMKVLTDQYKKDLEMVKKGKTPVVKDYNAPKTSNPLGKNMAPKPVEQFTSRVDRLASGIAHAMTPDDKKPMEYREWLGFSNVTLMSRGTYIQQVDDAVKQCLTVTGQSVDEYQLREQANERPLPTDPDLVERMQALSKLRIELERYLNVKEMASRRSPMAMALRVLVLAEMKLLDDAWKAIRINLLLVQGPVPERRRSGDLGPDAQRIPPGVPSPAPVRRRSM